MRRGTAAIGSAFFLVLAPGTVAGIVPWWLTRWRTQVVLGWPLRALGVALIAAGVPVLVSAFARFALEGLGTPAPVAPPARLVVGGLYRHVRNPMYLAVISTIAGQALWFGDGALLWWAAIVAAGMVAFVKLYEEPTLRRKFGEDYAVYCRAVRGWWPRWRGWRGPDSGATGAGP